MSIPFSNNLFLFSLDLERGLEVYKENFPKLEPSTFLAKVYHKRKWCKMGFAAHNTKYKVKQWQNLSIGAKRYVLCGLKG